MTRMPRGQCTLSADEAGRILDRLAGLEQVIRPDDLRQALQATGRVSTRACVLTSEVILWVVLAMGLLTDLPIRQVFKSRRVGTAHHPSMDGGLQNSKTTYVW